MRTAGIVGFGKAANIVRMVLGLVVRKSGLFPEEFRCRPGLAVRTVGAQSALPPGNPEAGRFSHTTWEVTSNLAESGHVGSVRESRRPGTRLPFARPEPPKCHVPPAGP